jgi:hypothetical protein
MKKGFNKYRCPCCQAKFVYKTDKKFVNSYCEIAMRPTRLTLIPPETYLQAKPIQKEVERIMKVRPLTTPKKKRRNIIEILFKRKNA